MTQPTFMRTFFFFSEMLGSSFHVRTPRLCVFWFKEQQKQREGNPLSFIHTTEAGLLQGPSALNHYDVTLLSVASLMLDIKCDFSLWCCRNRALATSLSVEQRRCRVSVVLEVSPFFSVYVCAEVGHVSSICSRWGCRRDLEAGCRPSNVLQQVLSLSSLCNLYLILVRIIIQHLFVQFQDSSQLKVETLLKDAGRY